MNPDPVPLLHHCMRRGDAPCPCGSRRSLDGCCLPPLLLCHGARPRAHGCAKFCERTLWAAMLAMWFDRFVGLPAELGVALRATPLAGVKITPLLIDWLLWEARWGPAAKTGMEMLGPWLDGGTDSGTDGGIDGVASRRPAAPPETWLELRPADRPVTVDGSPSFDAARLVRGADGARIARRVTGLSYRQARAITPLLGSARSFRLTPRSVPPEHPRAAP